MKVIGLDGRTYTWKLTGHAPDEETHRSGPHLRARALLRAMFPLDPLVEEIGLPGTSGLRADFFLPRRRLVVEVQGRQHDEFVEHFHGDLAGFGKALRRDMNKAEWCDLNHFTLVELPDERGDDDWRALILRGLCGEPRPGGGARATHPGRDGQEEAGGMG